MIVLIGKTASGKESIVNMLVEKYNYKKIITYCTRPMRSGEENGVTYHFITEQDFKNKIENGFFAEWKTYDTEFGTWYYGTALEDLNNAGDRSVIILTPDGYRDILRVVKNKPLSILIDSKTKVIKERLLKRGDNKKEARRRLRHDKKDFKCVSMEVDYIIFNNGQSSIPSIAETIHWLTSMGMESWCK